MRTILLLLTYVLLTFVLLILILFFFPFGIREPLLGLSKWAVRLGSKILGIRIEVSGVEKVGKRSAHVFMANHLSFLDGPMLFMLIPRPLRVILKKEVFRIPVIGQGMRYVGFVPVDRKHSRGGKKSIDKAAGQMREKGHSFLIFPEGTRSRDGRIQAFRRGGFFLALESQAPIVPISIRGTYELMPRGSLFAKKGRVFVQFHSPVPVESYNAKNMQVLIEKVKGIIESGLEDRGIS
jgi:1-acyl-sn-glycerol-3-phosphate acyltransferase